MIFQSLHRACPEAFHGFAGRTAKPLGWAALVLTVAGLGAALVLAPDGQEPGDKFRIGAVHYPAAWASLCIYVTIGALSAVTLRHRSRLTGILAAALAPTGVLFTLLALWTESLWRRPSSGTWWAWDAEAVSQLMMLFLFGGFIAVRAMIDDPRRADQAGALLAVLGTVNLPVLYFSLHWWDMTRVGVPTPATFSGAFTMATVLTGAGFAAYAAFAMLKRVRCLIAERNAFARNLRRMLEVDA